MRFVRMLPVLAVLVVSAAGCGDDHPVSMPAAVADATADATADAARTTDVTTAPTPAPSPAPSTPSPSTPAPADVAPAMSGVHISPPFGDHPQASDYVPVRWLVPWSDGFLAIGYTVEWPLPDRLPPEVADLFPPEITTLFEDGLPATRTEAIAILEQAGLADEALEIVNANPEAMAALNLAPETTLLGAFTADGEVWTTIDLGLPGELTAPDVLAASGDRITLSSMPIPADEDAPREMTLATTTDLATWRVDRFEIDGVIGPIDPAAAVYPFALAANDTGWVAAVLIDGMSGNVGAPAAAVLAGSWGEPPVAVDVGSSFEGDIGPLIATADGFLLMGDGSAHFSTEGTNWSRISMPSEGFVVQTMAPLAGRVLVIGWSPLGDVQAYSVDGTGGDWVPLEIPLDASAWFVASDTPSAAFTAAATTEPAAWWVVATSDGERWLIEPYTPIAEFGPYVVATNGVHVLAGETDAAWTTPPQTEVWTRYALPTDE